MAGKKSKLFSKRSRRSVKSYKRQLRSLCASGFEQFECRRVLDAGYFEDIADDVSGPSSALSTITSGLHAVGSLAKLPLINKPLSQISQLTEDLTRFQNKLDTTLRSFSPASAESFIKEKIYEALGPDRDGIDVLATKSRADITVTAPAGSNSVDVSIDLGYTTEKFDSAIGLGVDSVPFQPGGNSNGKFSVGLKYENFNFGYNTTDGVYFRTNTSNNELQLTLNGFLPSSFTAGLGFLNVSVTDFVFTARVPALLMRSYNSVAGSRATGCLGPGCCSGPGRCCAASSGSYVGQ